MRLPQELWLCHIPCHVQQVFLLFMSTGGMVPLIKCLDHKYYFVANVFGEWSSGIPCETSGEVTGSISVMVILAYLRTANQYQSPNQCLYLYQSPNQCLFLYQAHFDPFFPCIRCTVTLLILVHVHTWELLVRTNHVYYCQIQSSCFMLHSF